MRAVLISVLVTTVAVFSTVAFAANGKGKKRVCMPATFANMKQTKRFDPNHIEVATNAIGYNSVGLLEVKPGDLPIFGDGFLDVEVEHIGSKNGIEQWRECDTKSRGYMNRNREKMLGGSN